MKQNIKIVITPMKLCYSIFFMLILAIIAGITRTIEIGAVMDANVALLAAIFCADTFDQEFQANRWEVFHLLPARSKYMTICLRILLQIAYLSLLLSIGYWLFYLQKPTALSGKNEMILYASTVLACMISVIVFAALSITLVNLFHNLWAGIGVTLSVWYLLNPVFQNKITIPKFIDVFRYQVNNDGYPEYLTDAKFNTLIIAILLLIINYKLIVNGKEKIR